MAQPHDTDAPPPIFDKMDALLARHRGAGPNQSIPVLTEIASPYRDEGAARGKPDPIPVLTEVATMIGDDLMFTPDEIRPDETPPPVVVPSPPSATPAQNAMNQSVMNPSAMHVPPAGRQASAAHVLAQQPVTPRPDPAPAPAEKPPQAGEFEFPDLSFDDSALNTPAKVVSAPMASSAKPTADELLMPELKLSFDFAPPPEQLNAAAPVARPAAAAPGMSRAMMESHTVGLRIDLPTESDESLSGLSVFESATVGLRVEVQPEPVAPPPPPVVSPVPPPPPAPKPASSMPEAGALANELMAALKPQIEKMVRAEMSKQIALLHSAAIKNVMLSMQPKLGPMVAEAVRQVLAKRGPH